VNTCFFCGPTEEIITEEHIWPQWVSRLLHGRYGADHFVNIRSDESSTTARRQSNLIDYTSTTVCKPCNSEWLSAFENDVVLPVVTPMIGGDGPVLLDANVQSVIAAWAYKISLFLEVPDRVLPAPWSTPEERLLFRQTTLAHPMARVFIARYQFGQHPASCIPCEQKLLDHAHPEQSVEYRTMTITAGHLAMQVLSVRDAMRGLIPPERVFGFDSDNTAVLQVWPTTPLPHNWPPSKTMDGRTIEDWAQTFKQ
jgi:hypothetical protein